MDPVVKCLLPLETLTTSKCVMEKTQLENNRKASEGDKDQG